MDWFRWYHGTVTDPKWRFVAVQTGATVGEVLAVWACMMEHASQTENRGTLEGWRDEVYAMLLELVPERVSAIREGMQGLVLSEAELSAWAKRQPKDATAAERMRRYRERKGGEVTPALRAVTPSDVEESRGEEIREEKRSRGKSARERALASWKPNDGHQALTQELNLDPREEEAKFRDYALIREKPYANLDAGYRTWLRRAPEFRRNGNGRKTSGTPADEWDGTWAEDLK